MKSKTAESGPTKAGKQPAGNGKANLAGNTQTDSRVRKTGMTKSR
jgi:hypothetical protein